MEMGLTILSILHEDGTHYPFHFPWRWNSLSVPFSMEMGLAIRSILHEDGTDSKFETSALKTQTPGDCPKTQYGIQHTAKV
jgi:hypothetical protein